MLQAKKELYRNSTLEQNRQQLENLKKEIKQCFLNVGLFRNEIIFLKLEISKKSHKKMFLI